MDGERKKFFEQFRALGWDNDPQARSVFGFLMDARKQIPEDSILLDLGAGECRYSFFFKHCRYLSVDFTKGDAGWDYSKLDLIGDVCRPHFVKDDSVDFCLNTTTLEHLSEPVLFFKEVKRILKPGGKLFLYVPFVADEHQAPNDFFRYTSYGLRHLCDKSGLKVVSLYGSNKPLYTGIRCAHRSLGQADSGNIFVKVLLKSLRGFFRFLLFPLFDRLEVYSTADNFPTVWILIAEKDNAQYQEQKS